MTGDGSQEMNHGRRMTINLLPSHEDIEVTRSYTLLEITYYDFKLGSYNGAQIRRYRMYCRLCRSSEYDTDHYSEHYSEIQNDVPTCTSSNAEFNPKSDPELLLECL